MKTKVAMIIMGLMSMFSGKTAFALDPFTVAAAAKTAGSIYSGDVSSLGALADSAESLGGLLLDLDIDSSNDEEGRRQLKELQDLSKKADEAKIVDSDLRQTLKSGLARSESVSDKINQARKMIEIQRKIANLFGLRPKLAEHANSIQQTQVNYLILDELIALHQLEMRSHLDAESSFIARKAIVEKIRTEELEFRRRRGFKDQGSASVRAIQAIEAADGSQLWLLAGLGAADGSRLWSLAMARNFGFSHLIARGST